MVKCAFGIVLHGNLHVLLLLPPSPSANCPRHVLSKESISIPPSSRFKLDKTDKTTFFKRTNKSLAPTRHPFPMPRLPLALLLQDMCAAAPDLFQSLQRATQDRRR